ncbi:tyrosine--tRNA ligase [Candidatus Tremblaya phenacola]|uniref:Tyrosine--tRNA ligase n=1 Tax=Candidatus Tremblayella phenacoccinincola TaxID=1010676 RepID=A0A2G0V708_9PROT|nr:tyrosine--tRNA ligase [Candidatus Tremblaya phenacola]PHN16264.1 Tyrosine--tRNA ligase [Candidatus Tremblaya phenacola]
MFSGIMHQLDELGLIADVTNKKDLFNRLAEPISLYCGFDPTSDSLHIGHLLPLLCLKRFQLFGHRSIVLIGGGTGLIGDPSFRINERLLDIKDSSYSWSNKLKQQILAILNRGSNDSILVVNNFDWFYSMKLLTFISEIGRLFSINNMISKDFIKQRIYKSGLSLSFSELTYSILQSYDFAYLFKNYKAILQIGGSDQWGNITAGISLIYKLYNKDSFGLTLPLLTNPDGTKLSKTGDNIVWLDPNKTSPYIFYQYWVNVSDEDAFRYASYFTLMNASDIKALKYQSFYSYSRIQYILAEEVTRIVHGNKELIAAKRITNCLYSNEYAVLNKADLIQLSNGGLPMMRLKKELSLKGLKKVLVELKLASSITQAKRMICSKSIAINGIKQLSENYRLCGSDILCGSYTLIRRGIKEYCLIYWE